MLQTSVTAGPRGPVIALSGEAEATCVGQLAGLIDAAALRYADPAAIREFAPARPPRLPIRADIMRRTWTT